MPDDMFSFIRFESWSLVKSPLARANRHRTPRNAQSVLGEAYRLPGYAPHISETLAPPILSGNGPGAHERLCAEVEKAKARGEKGLRRDTHVLLTIVASYPVATAIAIGSEAARERLDTWLKVTLAYFEAWATSQNAKIDAILLHLDELYPHIHVHIFPIGHGMRAKRLHPGTRDQEGLEKLARHGNLKERLITALHRAFTEALEWEREQYWKICGAPFGFQLESDNPRRRRTRSGHQWYEKQQQLRSELSKPTGLFESPLPELVADLDALDDEDDEAILGTGYCSIAPWDRQR